MSLFEIRSEIVDGKYPIPATILSSSETRPDWMSNKSVLGRLGIAEIAFCGRNDIVEPTMVVLSPIVRRIRAGDDSSPIIIDRFMFSQDPLAIELRCGSKASWFIDTADGVLKVRVSLSELINRV